MVGGTIHRSYAVVLAHPAAAPAWSPQVFSRHSVAPDMLLDVLSDRGFSGSHIVNERVVPARVNPDTWEIVNQVDRIHKFRCCPQAPRRVGPCVRFDVPDPPVTC